MKFYHILTAIVLVMCLNCKETEETLISLDDIIASDTIPMDTTSMDTTSTDTTSNDTTKVDPTLQALWDEIAAYADIYYESWDTYQGDDDQYNVPVKHGDGVGSWKPKGSSVISNCDLVWEASEPGQPDIPAGYQWWAPEGSGITRSLYYDRDNWDRYVHIPNGFPQRWQSYPGWTDLSDTHDFVYIFRRMPGNVFETLFSNIKVFDKGRVGYYIPKSSYPDVVRTPGPSPVYGDLFAGEYVSSEEEQAPKDGEDAILRIQRDFDSGQIRVWINDKRIIDFVATPGIDFKNEFTLGTSAHPLDHHSRALLIKNDGKFTDEEYEKILENTNLIWPRGQKPAFPYLDGVHSFRGNLHFKSGTNTWEVKSLVEEATFTGGSGVPGNHTIQWFYWNEEMGSTYFRKHLPFEGATDFTLDRDDYNQPGQPFFGHEGDGTTKVFFVITPYDDQGVAGEPIRSAFVTDVF